MAPVFGVISPKRRITIVKIPLAIPTATLPNRSIVNVVTKEDTAMLTMLLPIKMVLSIFP